MGWPSLEGVDVKLNRAQDHFEALGDSITKFLRDPDSYSLAFEQDSQRRRGRLPAKTVKRSAFPIFNSGPKVRKTSGKGVPTANSGWAKIEAVSSTAQSLIEALQPYHHRKNPRTRTLWQLHELSNVDKHRLLHVTYSSLAGSRFGFEGTGIGELRGYEVWPGPLKRNAVLARWDVVPLRRNRPMNMHMDVELVTDITFGKGSPVRAVRGQSVLATLYGIASFIASDVLPPLAADMGLTSRFRLGQLLDSATGEFFSL